jgi:hypothetical protein
MIKQCLRLIFWHEVSSTVATLREAVAVLSGLVNRLDNKAPADE